MENIKSKKNFSLKNKITLSIVLFVIATLTVVFVVSFLQTTVTARENLRQHLLNEVNIAVLQIDAEKHSLLRISADEDTQAYRDIKIVLQRIRNNSNNIYYIYTLRENENKDISFIVDAEEDSINVSHLGDVYDDANPFLKDNFLTLNKPMVESGFTTDRWGTWMSAYTPFYGKDGKREGVLGIDIKAADILNQEKEKLLLYLLLYVLSGIFSTILGIFLSKNLINSLTYLTNILKNDKNNKSEAKINIAKDEIEELGNALKIKLDQDNLSQKEASDSIVEKNKILEKMNELMVGRELEMVKLKKEINELKKDK